MRNGRRRHPKTPSWSGPSSRQIPSLYVRTWLMGKATDLLWTSQEKKYQFNLQDRVLLCSPCIAWKSLWKQGWPGTHRDLTAPSSECWNLRYIPPCLTTLLFLISLYSWQTKQNPRTKPCPYCHKQQFHLVEQIKCLSMFYGDRLGQDKIPTFRLGQVTSYLWLGLVINLLLMYTYVCLCEFLCIKCTHGGKRGISSWVTGSCEPTDVGPGNGTCVFCKSSKHHS